ncbi:MAG: tetratricopeptide repeat protein, partial [Bacteroidota bacterium]
MKTKLFSLFIVLLFCFTNATAQEYKAEKAEIEKLLNQAVVDFNDAKYDKALESSKQALINSFATNDNSYIAQSYNTIGVIYNECSDSKKAIGFYEKALFYAKKTNKDKLYNWIYGNLGSVYYYNDIDVAKGINYYKKALKYAEKIKDSTDIKNTKMNIASAYFAIDKFDEGNLYLKDIQENVLKDGDQEIRMRMNSLLGIYATNHNKKAEAEQY